MSSGAGPEATPAPSKYKCVLGGGPAAATYTPAVSAKSGVKYERLLFESGFGIEGSGLGRELTFLPRTSFCPVSVPLSVAAKPPMASLRSSRYYRGFPCRLIWNPLVKSLQISKPGRVDVASLLEILGPLFNDPTTKTGSGSDSETGEGDTGGWAWTICNGTTNGGKSNAENSSPELQCFGYVLSLSNECDFDL
jgi:hypothetical protein